MPKTKATRKIIPLVAQKLEIDQILYHSRQVFLTNVIDEKNTVNIIKELKALNEIDNKPITMHINSRGGYMQEGLAIIDTMRIIKAPIITVITGIAASMAGIVAVTGAIRAITRNAVWMGHNGHGSYDDYFEKIYDEVNYLKQLEKQVFNILKKKTKLTIKELTKIKHGELWLFAKEAKKKNIVDFII